MRKAQEVKETEGSLSRRGESPASRERAAHLGGQAARGGRGSHTWEPGGVEEAAAAGRE